VDHNFYQNGANHHGFMYQHTNYLNNPSVNHAHRHMNSDCPRYKNLKLATIYVKPQVYNGINSPAEALKQGTAFSELYRPFMSKGGQST